MSKSNSLNRSSSAETENDSVICSPKDPIASLILEERKRILEEGNENPTSDEGDSCCDTSTATIYSSNINEQNIPNNNNGGGSGREVIPSSPPPSYEFVLEENRIKQQESFQSQSPTTPPKEIMHKSSKEFYKAVAKQFGITCKMSDHCRCYDCQSHYFDCEYEQNEQEKTDGGLGAGTPVFLNEVMHGTACTLL